MKEQEILEGNKLIAEFMQENINSSGNHITLDEEHLMFKRYGNICGMYSHSECYHSSWDWLMPVVDRIEELRLEVPNYNVLEYFNFHWTSVSCTIQSGLRHADGETKSPYYYEATSIAKSRLEATWLAIVGFIKWYNENKRIKERN